MLLFFFLAEADDDETKGKVEKPKDSLPVDPMINALTCLRHTKFFQVRFCCAGFGQFGRKLTVCFLEPMLADSGSLRDCRSGKSVSRTSSLNVIF